MAASPSLAILGGQPVCDGGWPRWPQVDDSTLSVVQKVLTGERWAVSGPAQGQVTLDIRFGVEFAAFVGSRYCLTVDHGSSALVAALTALNVGPGDEVIVPGLTWVACATAVLRCGAVPVLVDVDPATLCIDPATIEAAVTSRTAAIIVVHLFSVMADMDAIGALSRQRGIPIVEDAAHVPGAMWRDHSAGTLGALGTFSMQQTKLLTAGEGGAVVTSDTDLYHKIEQLRGDGRQYIRERIVADGYPDLTEAGAVQGWNMHLSEAQSALLLGGLATLEQQNERRQRSATILEDHLSSMNGISFARPYDGNSKRAYYYYTAFIDPEAFSGRSIDVICRALSAEVGCRIHVPYLPLDVSPLYNPLAHPFARLPGYAERVDPRRFSLPNAHASNKRLLALHHSLLLAEESRMALLADAIAKIQRYADLLPST